MLSKEEPKSQYRIDISIFNYLSRDLALIIQSSFLFVKFKTFTRVITRAALCFMIILCLFLFFFYSDVISTLKNEIYLTGTKQTCEKRRLFDRYETKLCSIQFIRQVRSKIVKNDVYSTSTKQTCIQHRKTPFIRQVRNKIV